MKKKSSFQKAMEEENISQSLDDFKKDMAETEGLATDEQFQTFMEVLKAITEERDRIDESKTLEKEDF